MLPSLQDLPGLLPGIFHRGDGVASEFPGRGLGHRQHVDHSHHGHHGRDRLHLSPEAEAVQASQAEDGDGVGEGAVEGVEGRSLLGRAGGFVRKALEAIRHDLGKALKAFGFDSDTVQHFTKAFVEPVLSALKEGVSFSAELSFAAFSQVTTTAAGGVSQSTTLVAQSLEIEVNRDTGEVSVSLASLSFEEQFRATTGNGQPPLLVIDPDELATSQELTQQILEGGVQPVESPEAVPVEAADDEAPSAEETEGEEETAPATELEETLADVRKKLAEDAVELQTRLTIYSVSTYKNDKGETITKMLLDAQLRISALADEAPVQDEAESLDLTA